MVFFVAWSTSSGVSNTVVLIRSAPVAFGTSANAAALVLSGASNGINIGFPKGEIERLQLSATDLAISATTARRFDPPPFRSPFKPSAVYEPDEDTSARETPPSNPKSSFSFSARHATYIRPHPNARYSYARREHRGGLAPQNVKTRIQVNRVVKPQLSCPGVHECIPG